MSILHKTAFSQGSCMPAHNPNTMRVFGMRFCPYAQRIRLLLHHLKLRHEVVNINTSSKPEWFLQIHPDGSIPLLNYKGHLISESLVCMEFLQEEFGSYALLSPRPMIRAHQRSLLIKFSRIASAFTAFLSPKDSADQLKQHLKILEQLAIFELELYEPFFSEDNKPSLLDFAIWPWFERFPAASSMHKMKFVTEQAYPKLYNWMKSMKRLDAVKKVALSDKLHSEFYILKQKDPTNIKLVDLGLDEP